LLLDVSRVSILRFFYLTAAVSFPAEIARSWCSQCARQLCSRGISPMNLIRAVAFPSFCDHIRWASRILNLVEMLKCCYF